MVEHICIKCKKIFTRKDTYTKHTQRKNSCISETQENNLEINHNTLKNLILQQSKEIVDLKIEILNIINLLKLK